MHNIFYHKCAYCDWQEWYITSSKASENRASKRIAKHELIHMKEGE